MPFTEHNMPSRPNLQMLPLGAIHHPLSGTIGPKQILSQQADVLREELIGYVNAIIERMDKGNAVKTMETFQIETASRKTFRQLTEHYGKLDQESRERFNKIVNTVENTKKRAE